MYVNGKFMTPRQYRKELKRQRFLKEMRKRHDVLTIDELRAVEVLEGIMHTNIAAIIPGFSRGKFELLLALGEVYKDGGSKGIPFNDLAAYTGVPLPHLSRGLKKLEEEKLIRRKQDPHDKRSTVIYFTPKGKEQHDKTAKIIHDFYIDVFEHMSAEKIETLVPLLEQLNRSLNREIKRRVEGNAVEELAEFMNSPLKPEDADISMKPEERIFSFEESV